MAYSAEERIAILKHLVAQIEKRWIEAAQVDPRLAKLPKAIAHFLLESFGNLLPQAGATPDETGFDPIDVLTEWNGKGTKFADAVPELQKVFAALEDDDLTDPPEELAALAGIKLDDEDRAAMRAAREEHKEKKHQKAAAKEEESARARASQTRRTVTIGVLSLIAIIVVFAGLYFGPAIAGLLPDDSPINDAVAAPAGPLNKAPVDRDAAGAPIVYQLQLMATSNGARGFSDIDMSAADCGPLSTTVIYVVTKVVGRDYQDQPIYAYWDMASNEVCYAPSAYFDWHVAGQPAVPVIGVQDVNVQPLIDKLNALTYKLGASGLMSKDQPLGKLSIFLLALLGLVALGELFSRHWVAGISGIFIGAAMIARVSLDNANANSPIQIWLPMVVNIVLTLGIGSIVLLLSEAKFNLKAFTQMPEPDKKRYLAVLAAPILHATEWSWGSNIMAVYVANYLFGPTSKTLVGFLGLPGAALITALPILVFDFFETSRRHSLFKHYDEEWLLKNADWVTYGVGWVAVLVVLFFAVFTPPGTLQTLWITLSVVVPFALIAGFLNGGQGRGLERGFDFVRTVLLTSLALLPLLVSMFSKLVSS